MTELLGLPYSPWTEKARWALDVRRVPYRFVHYSPLLGEPLLRVKLGQWTGVVSVPVLTDDDGKVTSDSAAIARWADGRGEGAALFPPEHASAIDAFVELSERGLAAARNLSLVRMLADDDALLEMVPRALRRMPGATAIAAFGTRRTIAKYGGRGADDAAALARVLDELRASLAKAPAGEPRTLLGTFTFADVAMAQVLTFVEPPAFGPRFGRASRKAFTDATLRERYADLVAWRDALYEAYRPKT